MKWAIALAVGLPVVVYLCWLTGNLGDDELAPELSALMAALPAPQLPAAENAYYALIGLNAPEDAEPANWGRTWVAQAKEIDDRLASSGNSSKDGGEPSPTPAIAATTRKNVVTEQQLPCGNIDGCMARVAADPDAARKTLESDGLLLQRFDALLDQRFQEPERSRAGHRSPLPHLPAEALKLAAGRFALLAAEGKHAEALRRWSREAAFLLRMMEGSNTLICKLSGIGFLHRHHLLLAQYLASHPDAARAHAELIAAALLPPSPAELSLQRPLANEAILATRLMTENFTWRASDWRYGAIDATSPPGLSVVDALTAPFVKPKATANLMTSALLAWREADKLRGEAYRLKIREAQADIRRQQDDLNGNILSYRNPVGRVLASIAFMDMAPYFYKRDNIVADRLLMNHALKMISGSGEYLTTDDALRKAGLVHPYSGETPRWDSGKRTLSFVPPGEIGGLQNSASVSVVIPEPASGTN